MQACKHCGRIMGDKAVRRHEKVCEMNPAFSKEHEGSLPEELKEFEEPPTETLESVSTQPTERPSFPAAMCPDTLILHENRQMYFQVTGRRIGNVIYVEEVKMLR